MGYHSSTAEVQAVNYFLSIGRGRQADGKKNFQRIVTGPDAGKRRVYGPDEANAALRAAWDDGHDRASLVPTQCPVSAVPGVAVAATSPARRIVGLGAAVADLRLTWTLGGGRLTCDQYPVVTLHPTSSGYHIRIDGEFKASEPTLEAIKDRAERLRAAGAFG